MKKLIMVKYGELTTKKGNKGSFIDILEKNIFKRLNGINVEIRKDYYRMFVIPEEKDFNLVLDILSNIFGIYEICVTYEITSKDIDKIGSAVLKVLNFESFKTFKVKTNRSDKTYNLKSGEISAKIGGIILKNIDNISVDVHNPDLVVHIEIRQEAVYIYLNNIKCLGGYPSGSLGKAMLMLSGGIDSVVAGYLAMKRGVKLDFVYFESIPHTSLEARNKVIKLAHVLSNYGNVGKLFIVNFTKIQESIYSDTREDYMITIMRRMMYRIGTVLAKKNNCLALVNGESIGQVASQTLSSIHVVNEVTNYPIIRPLASFDKLEIMEIARKINSYEISILPYEDCCTIFVPKHPVINPRLETAKIEEEKIDYKTLIDECINNINIVKIEKHEEINEYL